MEHVAVRDAESCVEVEALETEDEARIGAAAFAAYDFALTVEADGEALQLVYTVACDRDSAWCLRRVDLGKLVPDAAGLLWRGAEKSLPAECPSVHDLALTSFETWLKDHPAPEVPPPRVPWRPVAQVVASTGSAPAAIRGGVGLAWVRGDGRLALGVRGSVGAPVLLETAASDACFPADSCLQLQPVQSLALQVAGAVREPLVGPLRAGARALVGPAVLYGTGFERNGVVLSPLLDVEASLGVDVDRIAWDLGLQAEPAPPTAVSGTDGATVTLPSGRVFLALSVDVGR